MNKFLFIFLFLLLIYFYNSNNDVSIPTYLEYDKSYNRYILDVSLCNIDTKNVKEKFERFNINVLALYPFFEKYYENILENDVNYFYIDNINDLSSFHTYYANLLEKLGLNNYKNYILISGIRIKKIIIHTKYSRFNNLKLQYSCIR